MIHRLRKCYLETGEVVVVINWTMGDLGMTKMVWNKGWIISWVWPGQG